MTAKEVIPNAAVVLEKFNGVVKNGKIDWDTLGNTIGSTDRDLMNYLKTVQNGGATVQGYSKHLEGLGKSFNAAAIGAKALDVAINVGIMLAISAGIKLISKGIDYLVNYSKNLKEAANAIKEEYDELKENQESLINQQKEVIEGLLDLQKIRKNGTLTEAQKSQLEHLEGTNSELEKEIKYLEYILKLKAREKEKKAIEVLSDKTEVADIIQDSNLFGSYAKHYTPAEKVEVNLRLIGVYTKEIEKLDKAYDSGAISIEKWKKETERLENLQTTAISSNAELIRTIEEYNAQIEGTTPEAKALKDANEALIQAAKDLALSLDDAGYSVEKIGDKASKSTPKITSLKEAIDSLQGSDKVKALATAWDELESGISVSTTSMADLIDLYPDLIKYINTETGAITLTKDVIKEKYELERQEQLTNLKNLKSELNSRMLIAKVIQAQANAPFGYKKDISSGMLEQPKYNTKAIDEELKSLEAQIALLEKFDIDDVSSKKSTSKKEDVWLKEANEKIATLKHQYDMEQITEKQYYDNLLQLNNHYFQGKEQYLDDYRKYEAEYYKGIQKLREDDIRSYLDTVERLYKVHQNEAQYINDLQWAFDNWSKMSDEQRKTISDKIMSAQSAMSENIITDIKHQIKLLENRAATEEQLIEQYEKIQQQLHTEAERYRSLGYDDDSVEIQKLREDWLSYQADINKARESIHRRETNSIQSEIKLLEYQGGKEKELVEQYKKLQVEAYDQISRLKEQGLSDEDELVREYTEMWRNAYKSMKDMQKNLTADRINDIEHQIYLLDKSIEYSGEENTTGKPNSQVIAQYEQLMQIAQEEMSKLFSQGFTENDTEVQEWQKRWYSYYDAIVQAGEKAYKEMQSAEKETLKTMSDNVKQNIDGLNEIINKTVELIKHEKKVVIDGLKSQKDGYKEIIDKRKELLRTYHDEANYQDEISDKQKSITKMENQLLAISLDTSDKGKAERLKLEEEISAKKKDLSKFQANYALDTQITALDKEYQAYEKHLDDQIDAINKYLNEEGNLRNDAMKRIQEGGAMLYTQLLEYNREYGTGVSQDISNAWGNAQSAMEVYGGAQKNVLLTLQQMTAALDDYANKVKALEQSNYSRPSYNLPANNVTSSPESVINQMRANSQSWLQTSDVSAKQSLHDSNIRLAEVYSNLFGEELFYNNTDGSWYLGKNKIKLYHGGGFVGGKSTLKSNEEFAKLMKKELVVTPNQMENFMNKTLPNMVGAGSMKPTNMKIEKLFDVNFSGAINKDTLPQVEKMLNNIPNMVTKALTEQLSQRGIKTGALIKSF